MAKMLRNNPNTALPLEPIKKQLSRFHEKYYLARISIGVPPREIVLPRKCKTATEASKWADEIVGRIRSKTYAKTE